MINGKLSGLATRRPKLHPNSLERDSHPAAEQIPDFTSSNSRSASLLSVSPASATSDCRKRSRTTHSNAGSDGRDSDNIEHGQLPAMNVDAALEWAQYRRILFGAHADFLD